MTRSPDTSKAFSRKSAHFTVVPFIEKSPVWILSFARWKSSQKTKVRAGQETVDDRWKDWDALAFPFPYDLNKHVYCFNAVAIMVQLELRRTLTFFVDYDIFY
mmetsp:Transcript_51784/g.125012  ORF Transcript_51784/g.125012 Transcript_51784/m.125012 type:complete len:103 (-) Transcript_51784:200-508(-)|eukprot:CAMPEP_0113506084 /NCGR_PEP_ID=MMETSP0014_2-20120614/35705_1 /TAXON_ID=2857 /ORGANISM="Nitzschia sp." /LENGTH=102 /DNA_ID=CAMNT_0000401527 /DNA_START=119 /DNA_END=427 /DNA_ORIENTATION=- /assembly_acc=CAM_ASM_000159